MRKEKFLNNSFFQDIITNEEHDNFVETGSKSKKGEEKIKLTQSTKQESIESLLIGGIVVIALIVISVIVYVKMGYAQETSHSQQNIQLRVDQHTRIYFHKPETQVHTKSNSNSQYQMKSFQQPPVKSSLTQPPFSNSNTQTEKQVMAAALERMQKQISRTHYIHEKQILQQQTQRHKFMEDVSQLSEMIPQKQMDNNPTFNSQNENSNQLISSLVDTIKQSQPSFYFFSVSITQMILNSELNSLYHHDKTIFKISLKQHLKAIIRTQLVHNVNFKGQIKVELTSFDQGVNKKELAIQKIMDEESQYYEEFYKLSNYNRFQLRFCLLVPSYNNVKSQLYLRNLDSIFMQDYENYHVVYIDDASPDQTGKFVQKYLKEKGIPQDKIKVYINQKNQKAMYNIYHGIHDYCPDGEIVGLIDGDDSLLGRKVLQLYNAVYQSKSSALVYSNFLKILSNSKTSFGFGTEVTKDYYDSGKLRSDMSLVGTHFMTFFSDLFKKIKKQDFCYQNGTFYDYAYDRAIITPIIEMAFPRVEYLAQITYEYRNDTGINDGTKDWQRVSKIILGKPAYKSIRQFSFIDGFIRKNKISMAQQEYQKNKSTDKAMKKYGINTQEAEKIKKQKLIHYKNQAKQTTKNEVQIQ